MTRAVNSGDNSQNMSLLEAGVTNSDQISSVDTTIVDGSALMSDAGPGGTLADIEDGMPVSDQISVYVVRKGDSLAQIAKMFGVSANTVIWANDIKGGTVAEGQTLVILPISGVRYVVKEGDTLANIARKYKGNLQEIASFNGISASEKLSLGDVVIVPDGEIVSPVPVKKPAKKPIYASGPNYSGFYTRPVYGGIRTQGLHGFNAVDIAVPVGTPIYATASGDVMIARTGGWNAGYGNYVVIRHANGTQSLYGHLSSVGTASLAHVDQGEIIGYSGNTGKSTGPHLHFEIRGAANPF